MAFSLNKSVPKKRQPKQRERAESDASPSASHPRYSTDSMVAKRQRVCKARVQRPLRRSARLNITSRERSEQQITVTKESIVSQPKGRKRSHETENSVASVPAEPFSKRLRASVDPAATRPTNPETPFGYPETPFGNTKAPVDPVDYWVQRKAWPEECFKLDAMSHLLARKRSTPSLRRKRSDSGSLVASSATPSGQKPREEKSAPYRDARYETLLETKGSYMGRYKGENEEGVIEECKDTCRILLDTAQTIPKESIFQDAFFQDT